VGLVRDDLAWGGWGELRVKAHYANIAIRELWRPLWHSSEKSTPLLNRWFRAGFIVVDW